MRVLVTGATGFLGSRVALEAASKGHEVRCLVRDGRAEALPEELRSGAVTGDLEKKGDLATAMEGVACVFHAAGSTDENNPDLLQEVNVGGTTRLLTAAEHSGSPRFVFVSSGAVGDIGTRGFYRNSKAEAEAIVRNSRLDWVVLRPDFIYGTGDHKNTGRLLLQAASGRAWKTWGAADFQVQPVALDDLAPCAVRALTEPGAVGKTVYFGGPPVSYRAFAEAAFHAVGAEPRFFRVPLLPIRIWAKIQARTGIGPRHRNYLWHRVLWWRRDHLQRTAMAEQHLGFDPRPYADGLAAAAQGDWWQDGADA